MPQNFFQGVYGVFHNTALITNITLKTFLDFFGQRIGILGKITTCGLSKSIFYVKNQQNISIFFIEEYQFYIIDIFWQLQFKK